MSERTDYLSDMPKSEVLEMDVELLLSGGVPDDSVLAELAPVVTRVRTAYARPIDESKVIRLAAEASLLALDGLPVTKATRSVWSKGSLRRRLVMPAAAAAMLMGMTSVAFAADGSAPGDALYGLDRALEAVGIGNGGAAERIVEAEALFANGQVADAVAHAAEAAGENPEAAAAAEALLSAAESLRANEDGVADSVRANVADMLEWMATHQGSESNFGQEVAEKAKSIADDAPGQSNANENGADNAADPSGGNGEPGPPDGTPNGPPTNPGNQGGRP